MHSTCLAFNKFNVLIYLQYCWEFIACNENLHLCTAHIMHRISTLIGQKHSYTNKYPCTDCHHRLNIQLVAKMGIEICRYQKFFVLALTLVTILIFDIP